MRRILSFLLAVVAIASAARAQDDDSQMLIFRTTGEVNLLYTSEIDSIVCSRVDRDSVVHDDVVTQVFYTADTALVVPIAEIDSVALGIRNEIRVKDGVRMMTAEDSLWIIRYDGANIYYRHDTPPAILPREGEKLFYGSMDRLFPIGLVARVTSVAFRNNEYVVGVTDIEMKDVFDRLFFAGEMEVPVKPVSSVEQRHRAPLETNETLEMTIDIGDSFAVGATDDFSIRGTVVADVLRGYYSMEADVRNVLDFNIKAGLNISDTQEREIHIGGIPLGVYALVFTPSIEFDGFVELNAELMANLHTRQNSSVHVSYRKLPCKDPDFSITPLKGEDGGTEAQTDITCKGELYMGVQAALDLNILREAAGARLKFKLGPSLQSEFGLGMLNQSVTYNPEVYGKAELTASLKMQAVASLYRRDYILWGEEQEHDLLKYEHKFFETTYDLFPRFFQTRAVAVETEGQDVVTMSTKSENEILGELETGFELLDASGEPVDSIFVGTIMPDTTAVQGFCGDIDISGLAVAETKKELTIRPVFHYAGRTVRAQVAPLMSDMQLQPMVFGGTNGVVTYLSGMPFTGSAVGGGTLYTAGPYLPVAVRDTVFMKPGPIDAGLYLDDYRRSLLVGTWSGVEGRSEVKYTFRADDTCSMANGQVVVSGTYAVNDPQSGRVSIYPDDSAVDVKVLSVVNVSETVLQYRTADDTALHTLNRR